MTETLNHRLRRMYGKYDYIVGLIVALILFVVLWYHFGVNFIVIALAAIGISVIFQRMLRFFKLEDERSLKVAAFASLNALVAAVVVIAGMTWLNIAHLLPSYGLNDVLTIISFVMFLLLMLWMAYYWHRGDVE